MKMQTGRAMIAVTAVLVMLTSLARAQQGPVSSVYAIPDSVSENQPKVLAQAYVDPAPAAERPSEQQVGPSVQAGIRYEEEIPVSERPGARGAQTVPSGNVPPQMAAGLQRKINFPRDKGDDIDVLKMQIFLDYHGYSVGEIDGKWGYNTGRALYIYQKNNSLPTTGQMDDRIVSRLDGFQDAFLLDYPLTPDDLAGPFQVIPRDYYAQSKMKYLPYESVLEKLCEIFHCSQVLMRKLNPGVDFERLQPGMNLLVPNVISGIDEKRGAVSMVRISKHNKWTEAFDAEGRFMFYYPSTLGSENDPLPLGTYQVTGVNFNPTFMYQPKLFWDADHSKPSAMIPPGPNSPVGRVWIATSRKSLGIHGTPNPENISRNTSHGCIRLANWDALQLAKRVKAGVRLEFVD